MGEKTPGVVLPTMEYLKSNTLLLASIGKMSEIVISQYIREESDLITKGSIRENSLYKWSKKLK